MKERFESDHTDHHALRYRRLRVERQEVLYGDAWPLLCRRGDALVLCGRGGSLALSDDGVTWSQLPDLATPAAPGGVVLALTAGRDGTLVAAVQRSGTLMILGADEPAEPWRGIATLDVDLADSSRACLTGLADGSLLLCLPGRILRSADGGAAWEPAAELPAGCGTLHPLQLGSGRLVAPVGGAAGDIALAESDDGGGTWNLPDGFAPLSATVAELPDGRLVLSYGMPHFPYGARAVVGAPSDGAPVSWGDEVYVLALSRYAIREKARPVLAGAGVSATTVGDRGRRDRVRLPPRRGAGVVRAHHLRPRHGRVGPPAGHRRGALDPGGPGQAAAGVPQPVERPASTHRGYLDNGMVRMRPDDRYEGGDYVENFEMVAYRRVAAEHRYFAGAGGKGAVVCRHPDGSLVYSSRDCRIHRSTDEGRTWSFLAQIPLSGREPAVFGFGVTGAGTFLASYAALIDEADPARGTFPTREPRAARSDDSGRTWTDSELAPRPTRYCGQGDGSRIVQLADGTVICFCGNAWNDAAHQAGYEGDVLLRSHDDGRTWGDWTVLPPGSCESNLLELLSGELLCATRFQREYLHPDLFDTPAEQGGGQATWPAPSLNRVGPGRYKNEAIMFSANGGYDWTTPFLVTRLHMVSADAVGLPDGRVVLTYDHKDAVGGPRALVSPDGGRTWDPEPYILAYHPMDARTSSVLLRDGRVLTLWAGARDEGVHATTWSPE